MKRILNLVFVFPFLILVLSPGSSVRAQSVPEAAPPEQSGSKGPPAAASVQYAVQNEALIVVQGGRRTPVAIEGRALAVYQQGTTLYVARGMAGVSLFDVSEPLSPRRLRDIAIRGSAVGFHLAGTRLWVETVERSAMPIDEAISPEAGQSPLPAAAGAVDARGPAAAARALPTDVVIAGVNPGTVTLAVGTEEGVRVGDRFGIFRSEIVNGESEGGFTGEELITVAEVVAVKERTVLAETGRSAIVRRGDQARPAKADQDNSWIYPPRVPDVGEISVGVRPLINAGDPLGLGILADLEATYWGKAYFAGVRLQPVGLGWTTDGVIVSTAALAEGGYDARAVAVGLGLGVSWINGDADYMLESFSGADSATSVKGEMTQSERQKTHAAFTLSQVARLGARDGFNLSLRNLLIFHRDKEDDESGFIYGGTSGRLAIPLGDRSDLILEGGGGVMGYWVAGVGVSTWLVGNGSPGSWRLSVSAGAAGIMGSKEVTNTYTPADGSTPRTSTDTRDIDIAGPMVSFGLTRRFAF